MTQLMESVRARPRGEARPTWRTRARALRLSAGSPLADDDYFAAGSASLDLPKSPRLPRILNGVGVLVIDDDSDTADLFATALSTCGADVVATTSARDAMRMLGTRAFDVVVTDIAMPGGDGYWLLGEIRGSADERTRAVPVVAATAFGAPENRARAVLEGFDLYLTKPVDPTALTGAVAEVIRRGD